MGLICFNLVGCIYPAGILALPGAELVAADAGVYPNNYEELARDFTFRKLKNPQNVNFGEISKPKKNMDRRTME